MKKILTAIAVGIMSISLMACQSDKTSEQNNDNIQETITITDFNGEVEIPYDPQRIAVLDMSLLDTIDALGLGDRVVAMPKSIAPEYLNKYLEDDNIVNTGSLKSVDFEALNSAEPDLIIFGTRIDDLAEQLRDIAPTVQFKINHKEGYMKTFKENINSIAKIFGKESDVDSIINAYDERIVELSKKAEGKNSLLLIVSDGTIGALGTDKRCSLIPNEIGFENLTPDVESSHGDTISFEFVLEKNPDYIFVLDRDAGRGVEGAAIAKDVLENDIIKKTDAYKNGNIVYLTPVVWYIAEGGIKSTDIMISDIENALN